MHSFLGCFENRRGGFLVAFLPKGNRKKEHLHRPNLLIQPIIRVTFARTHHQVTSKRHHVMMLRMPRAKPPNPPKDLQPLIPFEDLKKVVAGLARVPKDAISKPKPDLKKPN